MPKLTPDDYQAMAAFRHLLRKYLRFSKDLLKANANLTSEQYETLLAIKAFSPRTGFSIVHLSERLQVKHHSTINIVNRLAARKLIRRRRSLHDRREKHLELTTAGENLLGKLAAAHRREIRRRSAEIIAVLERLKR
jgi:DNA-binding MarR family transcriptional regulator